MSKKGGALSIERLHVAASSQRGGWIVSYADMMTIILTFFILLLSISTIAQTKYEMLVQAFTGERRGNLMEVQEEIDRIVEERALSGEIETRLDADGLAIEFSNALLFDSGEAELKPGAEDAFGPIERHLSRDLRPSYALVVEGYTDDVPITNGRYGSNWALSAARAIHVMERLERAGIDRRRLSIMGYADTRPATEIDLLDEAAVALLGDPELERARAANRRVIVRVREAPSAPPAVSKAPRRDADRNEEEASLGLDRGVERRGGTL